MIASRRPLLRFGFVLQAILLFAMQLADGSGVHRCPDHDSGVGVLALGGAPSGLHHHGGHQGDSREHHGVCPCLGACHQSTIALAPAGTAALTALPTLAVEFTAGPVASVRSQHSHRLPYAIGPPLPVPSDFV